MQRWLIPLIVCAIFVRTEWQRLLAAPLPPATFWGSLSVNGAPAADGTVITAWIGEIQYASTQTFSTGNEDGDETGLYVIDVPADDPNTEDAVEGGHEGETVQFFVEGSYLAGSAGWGGGVSNIELSAQAPVAVQADFTCSPLNGSPPLVVNCNDKSLGDVTEWEWDFGDGAVSALQNPSHIFRGGGDYSITLTASDPTGSDSATQEAYVKINFVEQIDAIDPLPPYCVLRGGAQLYERVVEITGTGLSNPQRHLQFRNDSTGELSINIRSEVTWESSTKAWVDVAVINHLLWSGSKVPVQVRLTAFSNNQYYPESDWSSQFFIADNETSCGAARPVPPDPNQAPAFSSTVVTDAVEDALYSYAVIVADPDAGDTLSIHATEAPSWLNLTDHGDGTAQLQGTPTNDHVGTASVTLRVMDAAGAWAEQSFTIAVANINDAPEVSPQTFELPENCLIGTVVGSVAATDVDAGDTLQYGITAGNVANTFTIDATTGQLTVARSLDYEAGPVSYALSVMVSDKESRSDTATIAVQILDQPEPAPSPALFIPNIVYHEGSVDLR